MEKKQLINYYEQYKSLAGKMCIHVKTTRSFLHFHCSYIGTYVQGKILPFGSFLSVVWWQGSLAVLQPSLRTLQNPTGQGGRLARPP